MLAATIISKEFISNNLDALRLAQAARPQTPVETRLILSIEEFLKRRLRVKRQAIERRPPATTRAIVANTARFKPGGLFVLHFSAHGSGNGVG